MSVTSAAITTNHLEYCRYTQDLNIITVTMTPLAGTLTAGDSFIFSINRERATNWPSDYSQVMAKTVTATTTNVTNNRVTCSFQIGYDDVDADGIARLITGNYVVTVSPSSSPLTVWSASSMIYITLVPVKEIRTDWCYGATLRAIEVLSVKFQPRLITGVIIDEISDNTITGPKPMVLTYALGAWTLSWDGGAPIAITPQVKTQYIFMDELDSNYILATIDATMLPTSNVTERILVVQGEMPDLLISRRIRNALSSIESMMGFPIEPHFYTSMPRYAGQSEIHQYMTPHWDRIGRPVDYIVPADGYAWPSFRLPYQWCIRLHRLFGFHSVDKIIQVEGDWWGTTIDRMSSYVTLVPALASFARWTVYTHPMLAPFFMHRNIPSFWQYDATFGLPDLREDDRYLVREAVARTAAASVLVEAQRAYQGGLGSEATSRDGLSNSRAYNPGGPYGSTIQEHRQWLQLEVPRIKSKLGGILLGTLGAS